jgi:ketosteroid isomerase-like protein
MAVTRETFASWVALYEQLWRTPGTDGLDRLFADDATYLHSPYEPPVSGLAAIAADWERGRDGADEEFTMSPEVVAVDGNTAVARVLVRYGVPQNQEYLDLWVVRFDDSGRCTWFEEWPFWPNQPWTAGAVRE